MAKAANHPILKRMKGMFIYKDIVFANWTTESKVRAIEQTFEFFEDDIIIASYPKSGSDVIEDLVYLILHKGDNTTFKSIERRSRIPFIEEDRKVVFPNELVPQYSLDYLPNMPKPRVMKTYLPYSIIGPHIDKKKLRVIIPIRNPKDTLTSNFKLCGNNKDYFGNFTISWDDYFKLWLDGCAPGGDWLSIVGQWWTMREQSNILAVRYEDIWEMPRRVIKDIATLLAEPSWEIFAQDIINTIGINDKFQPDSDLDFMNNKSRGNWKSVFTNEHNKKFEEKYKNQLYKLKLKFDYDELQR